MFRFSFILLLLIPFCVGCLGLGYKVGTKSLFSQDVKTVYVPIFESNVVRRDIAERLTEAVCKRIEAKSSYKVVGRPDADSVLQGTISRNTRSINVYNNFNDARQKLGTMDVTVTWKDRRSRDLRDFEPIPWNETRERFSATNYTLPEYGQSAATSEMEQINMIADQIVGAMEVPW